MHFITNHGVFKKRKGVCNLVLKWFIFAIKEESALIQYKFCFKAFLYPNIGVEVPHLIIK